MMYEPGSLNSAITGMLLLLVIFETYVLSNAHGPDDELLTPKTVTVLVTSIRPSVMFKADPSLPVLMTTFSIPAGNTNAKQVFVLHVATLLLDKGSSLSLTLDNVQILSTRSLGL